MEIKHMAEKRLNESPPTAVAGGLRGGSSIDNRQSKTDNPFISVQRRLFFGLCKELGLSDDDQRAIADGIIPIRYPGRIGPDGEISRKALFENPRFFAKAMIHLNKLKAGRQRGHNKLDGKPAGNFASKQQLSYIEKLAIGLGWDKEGYEDLTTRLERFAARLTGSKSTNSFRSLSTLTPKEASNIILALKNFRSKPHASE
jgi:hypothetical protein